MPRPEVCKEWTDPRLTIAEITPVDPLNTALAGCDIGTLVPVRGDLLVTTEAMAAERYRAVLGVARPNKPVPVAC